MAIHLNHLSIAGRTPLPTTPIESRTTTPAKNAASDANTTAAAASTPVAASSAAATPSFASLFSPSPTVTNVPPATPQGPPTAQSVFGSSPWLTNPTGNNPNGTTYGFNPIFFATSQTAATVAKMVGGTVVPENELVSSGPFSQNQPNLMVQLPNGGLINPGLVASFYTHGYPESMVDQMVANEVAGTAPTV